MLKNTNNASVDLDKMEIHSADRLPQPFYSELLVSGYAKRHLGRLFSIVNDSDDLEHSTALLSEEGRDLFFENTILPLQEHADNGAGILQIAPTVFFPIIDTRTTLRSQTCEFCKSEYKGLGNKYRYKLIIDEISESITFGLPGILTHGFDIAVSDCNKNNVNGTGYSYKTDGVFKQVNLCCNECAVSFCQDPGAIIYYNDFLNKGRLRVLTPLTEVINKNLGSPYLFRSLNI